MQASAENRNRLTPRMALNLAAPHTWPASIMPAFIGVCIASCNGPVSVTMALSLLVVVVLMQSSVNTFNDYFDFVKGSDTDKDNVDADDSVLVYNAISPRSALWLAIGYLACAFLLGVYIVVRAGIAPLVIALLGAVFVIMYSAGRTPISYLPLGELVSGIVMGGLIPLGTVTALNGALDFGVLALSIPTIIGVGLIMLTNNTCDIERDMRAGRRTFPVTVGRQNAKASYRLAALIWVIAVIVCTGICFRSGMIVVPFMVLAAYPLLKAAFSNPLIPETRKLALPQTLSLNIVLGGFYAAAILAEATPTFIL